SLREATALFVTEGVVLRDRRNLLVTLLQGPVGKRPRELAGAVTAGPDHILDARPLGEVVGGNHGNKVWRAISLDVVGNGQTRVGEQIAKQHVDLALLHQAARL